MSGWNARLYCSGSEKVVPYSLHCHSDLEMISYTVLSATIWVETPHAAAKCGFKPYQNRVEGSENVMSLFRTIKVTTTKPDYSSMNVIKYWLLRREHYDIGPQRPERTTSRIFVARTGFNWDNFYVSLPARYFSKTCPSPPSDALRP